MQTLIANLFSEVLPLADAVLHEGYLLYPYRASSTKNRHRFSIGGLAAGNVPFERSQASFEVLVQGDAAARAYVLARFLHVAPPAPGQLSPAVPRQVLVGPLAVAHEVALLEHFSFGTKVPVQGTLRVTITRVAAGVFRLHGALANGSQVTPGAPAEAFTMHSAQMLVAGRDCQIVSLTDPPESLAGEAARCACDGLWPVLAGNRERKDRALALPIVLEDFAAIAPESRGDFCDATEMDEMLSLRVRTLLPEEKAEARATDPFARSLVDRCEAMGAAELASLHGATRPAAEPPRPRAREGDSVVLAPRGRSDVLDGIVRGKTAVVVSISMDAGGQRYVGVVLDCDPGRDLGIEGRKPTHRFYFREEEIEIIDKNAAFSPRSGGSA